MKMRTKRLALVFLMLGCAVAFAGDKKPAKPDPWIGAWKMDLNKSQFRTPAPKEETLTVAVADDTAVKYSTKGIGADGSPYTENYDGKPDGKAYPLIKNGQEVARISYHRTSDHSSTGKADLVDGATMSETITVAKDGKTLTIKAHVKAGGAEFDETLVFTKP